MRIGVDVDGVLCAFNEGFIPRCIKVTGRDLFPLRPFDITTWNYPESYGYTAQEVSAVWESIKTDNRFWQYLGPYETTNADLDSLNDIQDVGHEVYFITARPGIYAKQQTETWLQESFTNPTVLISSHKGLCAQALDLDAYIDDKSENIVDVLTCSFGHTKTFVMDRPWNQGLEKYLGASGIYGKTATRVSSVQRMLALLHP